MKLRQLEMQRVEIPLKKPFKTALRVVSSVASLQIKIMTDQGVAGYGAASPTVVITGDTMGSIEAAVHEIWTRIKDRDLDDWDTLMRVVHRGIIGNTGAKAAVDIALHDLRGKTLNIPLYRLLGGARTHLQTDMTISIDTPEIMLQDSIDAVNAGFTALKVKLGNDSDLDLKRIKNIYEAIGKKATIRLDANQGWSKKEAVRVIENMLDAGVEIELVEQPVIAGDFESLKFVSDHISVPVLADESVFSYTDAIRLIQMQAADYINIKLLKTGGLEPAMRIASLAENFGVKCMIGCMMEGPISLAAAIHFGCGRRQIDFADLDAPLMYDGPLEYGFTADKNMLVPNSSPGLGIEEGNRNKKSDISILF